MTQNFEMTGGQVYLDGVKVTQAEVEAGRKALAVQEKPSGQPRFMALDIPNSRPLSRVKGEGTSWWAPVDFRIYIEDGTSPFCTAIPLDPVKVLAALEDKKRLDKWERMARHDGRPAFFEIGRYGSMRVYEQNFNRASTIREAIDARREES